MRVARTQQGLAHRNTLVLRRLKIYFQCFPGKSGSDAERGIAGVDYVLKIDGHVADKAKTGADGLIELLVPAGAPIELTIFGTTYDVTVRPWLEPQSGVVGCQRRLAFLGYDVGNPDGIVGRRTDYATLSFQADQDLEPDGKIGSSVQSKLVSEFGE